MQKKENSIVLEVKNAIKSRRLEEKLKQLKIKKTRIKQ
jgi:hypothetical protein